MRILLLSQFYPPIVGGEERHVQNLAAALVRRGHHVSVATLWYPGCHVCELDGKIRVYRIRGTLQRFAAVFAESERRHAPPFPDPELVLGLRKVMTREGPDIVHAHNWLLASAMPLKRWSGTRMVMTLHDYSLICPKKNFMHNGEVCDGPRLTKCLPCARSHYGTIKAAVTTLGNFALRVFARRTVDRFIAVSHAVARYTGLAESGAAFEVIPNFVPDDVGLPSSVIDVCLSTLPSEPYILFVGDLMHLKGVDVLVQAYAKLDRPPPLVLIGRKCADTPTALPPNVHIFSPWPHAAIMHAWRRCLFGVLPSVGPEACATVVMEAMACGKPVVASDIGGMPDLIDNGKTGLLVRPGDADELAGALKSLLASPGSIATMGATSLAHVEHLKASAVVARIENLYNEVLREKAPDGGDRGSECLEATGEQPCRS